MFLVYCHLYQHHAAGCFFGFFVISLIRIGEMTIFAGNAE